MTHTKDQQTAIAVVTAIISTSEAAQALNRKAQTLRKWACTGEGPIQPVRINGRLAWKVEDIANLQQGGAV